MENMLCLARVSDGRDCPFQNCKKVLLNNASNYQAISLATLQEMLAQTLVASSIA
jgi:hypothetical protein